MTVPTGLFQWTSEYSVGVGEIDEQHKMLFDLINQLFLSALNREHESAISEILDVLIDYTRTHFTLEEQLLTEAGYPVLASHHQQHLRFVEKMEAVAAKFCEGKIVTYELINFLKHWLKEHILETDMGYASYLAKSKFSADAWASRARAVTHKKSLEHTQRSWWKFWN